MPMLSRLRLALARGSTRPFFIRRHLLTLSSRRRAVPGARSFELPGGIFGAMAAAYLSFIAAMGAAFGGGEMMPLLLGICLVYLAMYLGVPFVMASVDTGTASRLLAWGQLRQRGLMTAGGHMSAGSVLAQVLIVPACVAFFGMAVLVIVRGL